MKKTTEISSYEKQAIDFLNATSTAITIKFKKNAKHFADDTHARDIYQVWLCNKLGSYTFYFGQSIQNTGKKIAPTPYEVLAGLTKNNPEDYDFFCDNYGYPKYSEETGKKNKTSNRIYNAVCNEYTHLCRLFTDAQMELMQEIQ